MLFILLVLAASLLLLSVALMLVAFLVALVDYLLGGGPHSRLECRLARRGGAHRLVRGLLENW